MRRSLLLASAAAPILLSPTSALLAQTVAAAAKPDFALPQGGFALLMRHAQTDPGIGDPPGYRLGVCSSQRNLSPAGRNYSQQLGAELQRQFSAAKLRLHAVKTSAWCRCRDTATLIAAELSNRPAVQDWPALNSTFDNRGVQPEQSGQVVKALQSIASTAPARRELWVTHQVNISALTGQGIAMGEVFIVRYQGGAVAVLGRLIL